MRIQIASILLLTAATAALAQPAAKPEFETVYSDAQRAKDQDLSRRFVQGMLSPSYSFEDQYAKWKRPVCPNVYGMSATSKFLLERRIREVAQQIGAPVDRQDPCIPNITIVVTPQPQATLDSIAASAPYLLMGSKKRQLTVTQPIQSWYTTFRRDYGGLAQLDLPWEDGSTAGAGETGGLLMGTDTSVMDGAQSGVNMGPAMSSLTQGSLESDLPRVHAQGTRLSTGVTAEMAGVVVIVDAKAIMGMTLGSLGDYVALLSLSQAPVTGHCQEAPSIANLMLASCDRDVKTASLSTVDVALLSGLYQTPEKPEMIQKQRIIGAMRRSLEAQATH